MLPHSPFTYPAAILLVLTVRPSVVSSPSFFFFNDTATTEIYTLSLHDALPILARRDRGSRASTPSRCGAGSARRRRRPCRSEEHTSELQSLTNLVCRLLLEKKKNKKTR